jgi:hypothetical protein
MADPGGDRNPESKQAGGEERPKEPTPITAPNAFEKVKGTKAFRNHKTGEIWERDMLHKNHYEVYKNKKAYEQGVRSRAVWDDGRPKSLN